MLLAVDIGNTNIKFGVFDGDKLIFKLSISSIREISQDSLAKVVSGKLTQPVSSAIVSSVVPEINTSMHEFLTSQFGVDALFVKNDFDFGLKINYEPLSDAGTDRLVNAFSAVEKYGAPCIVCSFGTALTIDVVDKDLTLIGGLIAPGMSTLATALKLTTSRLPEVEIKLTDSVIQNTTVGAIQSGIVHGYFGLFEGLISGVKKEIADDRKVIATGGFASLIAENTHQIDVIDENLLLDGLRLLHKRLQPA